MTARTLVGMESLSYRYPDGTSALEYVSMQVAEGERVGLIGPNGAGKSTLLLHLNGALRGANGSVTIGALKVTGSNLKAIRRMVGLVFQNPDDQLFCPTVFEDVAFGPRNMKISPGEVSRRVRESLEAVGLAGFGDRTPFHMSLGEKKRAAIATVLAMSPAILALDEPTGDLDPRGRREIVRLLKQLGGTQIIVSHDLAVVGELCERAIVLYGGRKVADGPVDAILSDRALLDSCGLL